MSVGSQYRSFENYVQELTEALLATKQPIHETSISRNYAQGWMVTQPNSLSIPSQEWVTREFVVAVGWYGTGSIQLVEDKLNEFVRKYLSPGSEPFRYPRRGQPYSALALTSEEVEDAIAHLNASEELTPLVPRSTPENTSAYDTARMLERVNAAFMVRIRQWVEEIEHGLRQYNHSLLSDTQVSEAKRAGLLYERMTDTIRSLPSQVDRMFDGAVVEADEDNTDGH